MDTASTIINRVITRLEDPGYVFFSQDDLVQAYNDALDEMSEATEFHENQVFVKRKKWSTYVDMRAYVPLDFLRVTAIYSPSRNEWLVPTTVRELDDTVGRNWEGRPDSSRYWWTRGLYFVGTYPPPSVDTEPLHVYYASLFHHVSASGGLSSGLGSTATLPPDFSEAIEHYMMYTLLAQRKETQKSLGFWSKYQVKEAELNDFSKNRMRRDKTPLMGARRGVGGLTARRR